MSTTSNQPAVPNARAALNKFKMEAAQEVGAGSVGGQMVKKMRPEQIMNFERADRTAPGHVQRIRYIATVIA